MRRIRRELVQEWPLLLAEQCPAACRCYKGMSWAARWLGIGLLVLALAPYSSQSAHPAAISGGFHDTFDTPLRFRLLTRGCSQKMKLAVGVSQGGSREDSAVPRAGVRRSRSDRQFPDHWLRWTRHVQGAQGVHAPLAISRRASEENLFRAMPRCRAKNMDVEHARESVLSSLWPLLCAGRGRPLVNLLNTCYMNAVLQVVSN